MCQPVITVAFVATHALGNMMYDSCVLYIYRFSSDIFNGVRFKIYNFCKQRSNSRFARVVPDHTSK